MTEQQLSSSKREGVEQMCGQVGKGEEKRFIRVRVLLKEYRNTLINFILCLRWVVAF